MGGGGGGVEVGGGGVAMPMQVRLVSAVIIFKKPQPVSSTMTSMVVSPALMQVAWWEVVEAIGLQLTIPAVSEKLAGSRLAPPWQLTEME